MPNLLHPLRNTRPSDLFGALWLVALLTVLAMVEVG